MYPADAHLADVVIILDKRWEDRLDDALEQLRAAGVSIIRADDDNSVVEGIVDANRVHEIEQMDCVDYVRKVMSWYADYPPGDPRDKGGTGRP